MSRWCWRCWRRSLRSLSSSAARAPTYSNGGQRTNDEYRAEHLHRLGGYRRRILLLGGYGWAAALSRCTHSPAFVDQGGQSRPRADLARLVAANGRTVCCPEDDRCVVACPIVRGDGRPAHCARGKAREVANMTIGFALDVAIAVLVAAVACWTIL